MAFMAAVSCEDRPRRGPSSLNANLAACSQARRDARHARRGCDHPDRRLLVFCVTLPCSACSRMFCFSSSRWPLVVSTGTWGVLPGPLWLLLSSGTGLMVFFDLLIISLRYR